MKERKSTNYLSYFSVDFMLMNVVNRAMRRRFILVSLLLGVFAVDAQNSLSMKSVQKSKVDYEVIEQQLVQGGYLIGRVTPNTQVNYKGKPLTVTPSGHFFIGFDREAQSAHKIELVTSDKQNFDVALQIKRREWKVERVDGLPPSKVNPKSKAVLKRIAKDSQLVKEARKQLLENEFYLEKAIWPATGRKSGVFGSQRILNGEPKRPHYGLDIAAVVGTPVNAPMSGVITMVHPDMFYSGGTIILDHGYGVSSTFLHLSAINVKKGQKVKQGELIGSIGATGRASGPHLDWRINWFNVRLDPELFLAHLNQN